jgi:hypothetical protein
MISKIGRWRPLFDIVCIALAGAAIYVPAMHFLPIDTSDFVYAPFELYAYFLLASVAIVLILILIEHKDRIYVGNSFLVLTSLKMVYAYLLLRPVLEQKLRPEKINFFFIFALFLTFETIVTSRMLNRK